MRFDLLGCCVMLAWPIISGLFLFSSTPLFANPSPTLRRVVLGFCGWSYLDLRL